jgi:hypothetical protein
MSQEYNLRMKTKKKKRILRGGQNINYIRQRRPKAAISLFKI